MTDEPSGISIEVSPETAKAMGLEEREELYIETQEFIDGKWVVKDTRKVTEKEYKRIKKHGVSVG